MGINWVSNDRQSLLHEYEIEYKLHIRGWMGDVFPTPDSFVDAYRNGNDIQVTKTNVHEIGGATNYSSPENLFGLIKTYRSYPEFRNEKTFQSLMDKMRDNSPIFKPIILKDDNGHLTMMSGNTRQNLALIIDGQCTSRLINVPTKTSEALRILRSIS